MDDFGNQPNKDGSQADFLKAIRGEKGDSGTGNLMYFPPLSLDSASNILLPTQANLEHIQDENGQVIYKLNNRITPYICEEIVQVEKPEDLIYTDADNEFRDDIYALGMFRGVYKNEKN